MKCKICGIKSKTPCCSLPCEEKSVRQYDFKHNSHRLNKWGEYMYKADIIRSIMIGSRIEKERTCKYGIN